MSEKTFILSQYLLPQFLLTRFGGWMATRRWPWLKNWLIKDFVRRYNVDLSIAMSSNINDYACFNDFFTRALKPQARPIVADEQAIACPVDGSVSQIGRIDKNTLLQAKGATYSLESLLGLSQDDAQAFYNGQFATLYLSPKDYHRVHLPFAGKLLRTIYIPGKLFSVNPVAAKHIPQLFARNERLVCIFDTAAGPMAVVFIGAMIVGKIETVWGVVERSKEIVIRDHTHVSLDKGAEIGRFLLGSSVILLFGKGRAEWSPELKEGSVVQMGQGIGRTL